MRTSPNPTSAPGSLTEAVADRLRIHLGLDACWYEPFPFDAQLPRIESGRVVLPAAEPGIGAWNLGGGVELPVRLGQLLLGRFVLVPRTPTCGVALDPAQRAAARAVADNVAPAIAATLV